MKFSEILKNTNLVFAVFIIAGFIFPAFADDLKIFLVPALMIMMAFSLVNFKFSELELKDLGNAFSLMGLNYIFLSGAYIGLAFLFVENPLYRNAMIVLGLMPPAVGIISLIYLLKGDINTGFIAEIMGYVISLFVIPVFTMIFFSEAVTITNIIRILVLVIVIPFLVSRIIVYINSKKQILHEDIIEITVNLCYGFLFYIAIGVNIDVFLNNFMDLFDLIFVLIFLRFGIGLILYFIFRKKISHGHNVLCILFGTFKNGSAGMAITVMLFGVEATVPYAIFSFVASFYIVFLKWLLGKD